MHDCNCRLQGQRNFFGLYVERLEGNCEAEVSCSAAQNKKAPRKLPESEILSKFAAARLVRAAGEQRHQHHQVRQGKQPLVGLNTRGLSSARDKPQVTALGKIPQMLDADTRQGRNLGIGENFLARFDGNHGLAPLFSPPLDVSDIVRAAISQEQ